METAVARKLHDDLLAEKPADARHDSDICLFCVDKSSQTTASDPSGSRRPDVSSQHTSSTEGGDNPTMTDISQEAHDALLKKAVDDAVAATTAALATKTTEVEQANARVKELETEVASAQADVTKLNSDLDAAQVKLTAAETEAAALKEQASKAEEAQAIAEVASKRSEQVKNLKLFKDDFITTERASRWAGMDEASWTEQVEEWKALAPANSTSAEPGDQASAITGTTEELGKEQQDQAGAAGSDKPKARRSVLGLS